MSIQHLPLEVLQHIFILSGNPSFPLVSQNFYKAANSQTSVKTQWLLCKYKDYKNAFFRGLKWKFFNLEILRQLDTLYCQQNPQGTKEIPYENRPIPQWFFSEEDPDGRLRKLTEVLLERRASPDESGGYPIIKSVQMGRIEMVKLLIKREAKVDIQSNLALRIGVAKGNIEMVKLLLDHSAQPSESGAQQNESSLQIAVGRGNIEMIKLLLDHGAQPDGKTLKIAAEKNFDDIYKLLKKYGAVEDLSVVNAFNY